MSCINYKNYLKNCTEKIKCVNCDLNLLPKIYLKHLKNHHEYKDKTRCIWCMEYTWKRGDINNYIHRTACLKKRIEKVKQPPMEMDEVDEGADSESIQGKNLICNNEKINNWHVNEKRPLHTMMRMRARDGVAKSFYHPLDGQLVINCDIFDENTNIDCTYVREFDRMVYEHVSVRASVWNSFMTFYQENRNIVEMLPYWCLCSGGREHHRHMIMRYARSDKTQVVKAWRRNSREKFRKAIGTRIHLINVICYVSGEKSQCCEGEDFNFRAYKKTKRKRGKCHYKINSPLPPYADLFFSLTYANGLNSWLTGKFKNKLIRYEDACRDSKGRWCVRISVLVKKLRNIVVPIKPHFDVEILNSPPRQGEDGLLLYLNKSRVMALRRNDELLKLSLQNWNSHQLNRGNNMMATVGNAMYYLGKKQQEILNFLTDYIQEKDATIAKLTEIINNSNGVRVG